MKQTNRIKFVHDTKKGQTVYEIGVNIRAADSMDCRTSQYKHGIFVKELKIVHQTNYKIALSGDWIPLLDRKREGIRKGSYHHFLEDVSVNIKTKESFWPNGIFAHLYSLENPQKGITKLKSAIAKQINSDYGFLRFADIEKIIEGFEVIILK